jgi:hypothetical protein
MGFHAFNWFSRIHISKCNLLLSVQTYTLYIECYLKLNNIFVINFNKSCLPGLQGDISPK